MHIVRTIGSVHSINSEAAHAEYGDAIKPHMTNMATLNCRLTPFMLSQVAKCYMYRTSKKNTPFGELKLISGAYPWGATGCSRRQKKLSSSQIALKYAKIPQN